MSVMDTLKQGQELRNEIDRLKGKRSVDKGALKFFKRLLNGMTLGKVSKVCLNKFECLELLKVIEGLEGEIDKLKCCGNCGNNDNDTGSYDNNECPWYYTDCGLSPFDTSKNTHWQPLPPAPWEK